MGTEYSTTDSRIRFFLSQKSDSPFILLLMKILSAVQDKEGISQGIDPSISVTFIQVDHSVARNNTRRGGWISYPVWDPPVPILGIFILEYPYTLSYFQINSPLYPTGNKVHWNHSLFKQIRFSNPSSVPVRLVSNSVHTDLAGNPSQGKSHMPVWQCLR